MKNTLLLGTRKGLVIYKNINDNWEYQNTHFVGIPVSIAAADSRTGTWWAMLDHGHWGVKLHRSNDQGENWEELEAPKYPDGFEIKEGLAASTRYLWAFGEGGKDHPNRIYIGTEPGGLFVSNDNGNNFELIESLWNHQSRKESWFGAGRDHPGIHSIIVDPRDSNHITVGASVAGVFESKDGGQSWTPQNKGLKAEYLPDPDVEVGHDPHILVASESHPDIFWQQNHCGIFKSENGGKEWQDVSQKENLAHFGFALVVDEKDPQKAWTVPCISDEVRVAIDQALCVCKTENGGKTWEVIRSGLPQKGCFDIVYRHALAKNNKYLAFGTTTGNVFISSDFGENWTVLTNYLSVIYSVAFV